MKKLKQFAALLLTFAIVLSLSVPAFAASDFTITITNPNPAAFGNHEYQAFQIFDGKLDTSGKILTEITWGESIDNPSGLVSALAGDDAFLVGGVNIFASAGTADQVANILAEPAYQTSKILSAFSKHVKDHLIKNGSGDFIPVNTSVDAGNKYTITIPEEKAGYYLVLDNPDAIDGKLDKDVSDFILRVVGDVNVKHKGSIPSIDKTVSETGSSYHSSIPAGIGEIHHYRIMAELPDDFASFPTAYTLNFYDTMDPRLTFINNPSDIVVKAIIRGVNAREIEVDPSSYNVVAGAGADPYTFKVLLDARNLKDRANPSSTITLTESDAVAVFYKATVNETITTNQGIPNTAQIEYSNDPNSNGTGKSTPDSTYVFPFNLEVNKVNESGNLLEGAEFVLYREVNDGHATTNKYAVVDAGKISKWVDHYEADDCVSHDPGTEFATVLESVGGTFSVDGLKPGEYFLRELTAPDGYNPLTEDIMFNISITLNAAGTEIEQFSVHSNISADSYEFDSSTATTTINVKNLMGKILPSTGGIGTTLFYVVGGLLAVSATVLLITKKRMNAED